MVCWSWEEFYVEHLLYDGYGKHFGRTGQNGMTWPPGNKVAVEISSEMFK